MVNWREDAIALMKSFDAGDIGAADFGSAYEHLWNFEREPDSVPPMEVELFEHLFDVATVHSPYSDERTENPRFKSEDEIRRIVSSLLARLLG